MTPVMTSLYSYSYSYSYGGDNRQPAAIHPAAADPSPHERPGAAGGGEAAGVVARNASERGALR